MVVSMSVFFGSVDPDVHAFLVVSRHRRLCVRSVSVGMSVYPCVCISAVVADTTARTITHPVVLLEMTR